MIREMFAGIIAAFLLFINATQSFELVLIFGVISGAVVYMFSEIIAYEKKKEGD